jgi:hypothetical protein
MYNLNFFSFIGFLKPLEISTKTSKLVTLSFLSKKIKNTFLFSLSVREIYFYILKNVMISCVYIHIKNLLQPNYNLIYRSFQWKNLFFSFEKIQHNCFITETFDNSFRFQYNPFVANLSYFKNYINQSKTRIKHIFLQTFVKKINEFKYILKKPVTQMLTAKVICSLSRRITYTIKNVINLLNLKILQVCIFLKQIFVLQQITIKNNLHKNYNWKPFLKKSYFKLQRETLLLTNYKLQSKFFQIVLPVQQNLLTSRKRKNVFNNGLTNLNTYDFWKPISKKLTLDVIRFKLASSSMYTSKSSNKGWRFFLNFKNLLVKLIVCLKKMLNKLLWKWFKNYKKSMTYNQYLQKSSLFIAKQNYLYAFDIML